jgi:hypothetical protein
VDRIGDVDVRASDIQIVSQGILGINSSDSNLDFWIGEVEGQIKRVGDERTPFIRNLCRVVKLVIHIGSEHRLIRGEFRVPFCLIDGRIETLIRSRRR